MTQTQKIGVGIVGSGLSATQHISALKLMPDVEVVAAASRSAERVGAFAQKWDIPTTYTDWHDLLADPRVQVIHTCTPTDQRVPLIVAAAEAGKHVMAEKPLARTVAEADEIIAACDRAGVRLGAMFQNRFTPLARQMKAAIEHDVLGKLLLIELQSKWWRTSEYYVNSGWRGTADREGGAALINQGIHAIDLLGWLAGPINEIQGLTATTLHPIEMEDVGMALLRFGNGAVGSIIATTVAFPGYPERLAFHGENGSAVLMQGEGAIEWALRGQEPRRDEAASQASRASSDPAATGVQGHLAQFTDFYEAVRTGRKPFVDGRDARHAVEIVEAIYRSSKERRPIALPLSGQPTR